jgi:hypothetical protein
VTTDGAAGPGAALGALGVLRWAVGLAGLAIASPASAWLALRVAGPRGSAVTAFAALVAIEAAGVAAAAWGLRSASLAAAVLSVVNLPLLGMVGVRAEGVRSLLFALPKYLVLAGVGYMAWPARSHRTVRWLGAILPTLGLAWLFVAPLFLWG